jgi:hypothetical protein
MGLEISIIVIALSWLQNVRLKKIRAQQFETNETQNRRFTCLPIGEDAAVVTFKRPLQDVTTHTVKHLLLTYTHKEQAELKK